MSGESEDRVSSWGAEWSLCGGDVGVFCDGGDEVSCEIRVREAEEAFLRSRWWSFVTSSLVRPVVILVGVVGIEA